MRSENGIPRPFQPNNLAQELRDLKRKVAELEARRTFVSVERIVEGGTINENVGRQLTETVQETIVIDGGNLGEGALDGQRMVGAIIETNATANRGVKIDDTGLRGYDSNGKQYIKADETGLSLSGELEVQGQTVEATPRPLLTRLTSVQRTHSGQTVSAPGLVFTTGQRTLESDPGVYSPDGLSLRMQGFNFMNQGQIDIDSSGIDVIHSNIKIGELSVVSTLTRNVQIEGATITVGVNGVVPAAVSTVNLVGSVKVNGAAYGAPQARVQPALNAGWTHYTNVGWGGLWVEQMGKLTIVSGAVGRTGGWAKGDTIATLPTQYRPANKVAGVNCELEANGALLIGSAGSGGGSINISYFAA